MHLAITANAKPQAASPRTPALLVKGRATGSTPHASCKKDADAATWTEVHTDDAELSKDLQVGVLAINTTTATFAPELREFKLTAK